MRAMALDYGSTAMGVAIGETIIDSARPLEVLAVKKEQPDWVRLDALMQEWRPDIVVIGMPYPSTAQHSRAVLARAKAMQLKVQERYEIECAVVDEHLSSAEARERARALGRNPSERIDDIAAQVILETWMHG